MRPCLPSLAVLFYAVTLSGQGVPHADDLDTFIVKQMALRHIQGLSLAIVQNGQIVLTRAYGVTDSIEGRRVDSTTLFQAGSISKPVSAAAALRLVEQGKLGLDESVDLRLTSWHLPPSRYTDGVPVTLRRLLSHTAGLTVHGFPGYDRD